MMEAFQLTHNVPLSLNNVQQQQQPSMPSRLNRAAPSLQHRAAMDFPPANKDLAMQQAREQQEAAVRMIQSQMQNTMAMMQQQQQTTAAPLAHREAMSISNVKNFALPHRSAMDFTAAQNICLGGLAHRSAMDFTPTPPQPQPSSLNVVTQQPAMSALSHREAMNFPPRIESQRTIKPALNHRDAMEMRVTQQTRSSSLSHREAMNFGATQMIQPNLSHRNAMDFGQSQLTQIPLSNRDPMDFLMAQNTDIVSLSHREVMDFDSLNVNVDPIANVAPVDPFSAVEEPSPTLGSTVTEPACGISVQEHISAMELDRENYFAQQQNILDSFSFSGSSIQDGDTDREADIAAQQKMLNCALLQYAEVPQASALPVPDNLSTQKRKRRHMESRDVRIFISSTFKDMSVERETLIKRVMPGIRILCAQRGVSVREVDLRWGITAEQSESGNTISICLSEIDKCRPWFFCMLGDRYGWSHTDNARDDLLTKTFANASSQFPWIMSYVDRSITELEIRHAILNQANPTDESQKHCAFFFRNESYSKGKGPDYEETNPQTSRKLKSLKESIEQRFPENVHHYDNPSMLDSLFSKQLMALIDRDFPEADRPTPLEKEREVHNAFAQSRARVYVGGEHYMFQINCFLASQAQNQHPSPIVIVGNSGSGKSALVCNYVVRYENEHPESFVLAHYIGCSGLSTDLGRMLHRIISEIVDYFELPNKDLPNDVEGLSTLLPSILLEASSRGGMLLVLDALNQLDEKDHAQELHWLPVQFPPGVQLITSTLPSRAAESLSSSQIDGIIDSPQTANPLFLKTVLNEIRVHGAYETLNARIAQCLSATGIPDLLGKVLARIETDFGDKKNYVGDCMATIWISRRGLTENEILSILHITPFLWSEIQLALSELLSTRSGLLNFSHDFVKQSVASKYITPSSSQVYRNKIITHFLDSNYMDRKCEEVPYHYHQAGMITELCNFITTPEVFFYLSSEQFLFDLYKYFRACSSLNPAEKLVNGVIHSTFRNDAAKIRQTGKFLQDLAHFSAAEQLFKVALTLVSTQTPVDLSALADVQDALGYLYRVQARYEEACPIYEESLKTRKQLHGPESREVAASMCSLAILFRKMGKYDKAEPLYSGSCVLRKKLLGLNHPETGMSYNGLGCLYQDTGKDKLSEEHFTIALQIREHCHGPNHPDVAMTLSNMASLYLSQARYDDSERLFERALRIYEDVYGEAHPDVAHTLAYLAGVFVEKGKYLQAKPLFERAISIKQQAFGKRHPEVAQSLSDYGVLHARMHDYDKALQLYQQCLDIRREVLGPDHPDTAQSMNNVAAILTDKGLFSEAETMFQEALKTTEKKFGESHPNICQTLLKLANLYQRQGRNPGHIIPLYSRSLSILRSYYGELLLSLSLLPFSLLFFSLFPSGHPDVSKACRNIAAFYAAIGNSAEESKFLARAAGN
ncbi:tetratricopeptide repeat protein [Pelomyxa schiedti]|nr:tetratricopeptide repeat protein [Pelomyxa schiedti]